ncbi:hypothetical protein B0J14DRAFT_609299 [Halenospora varia]|nr:hypothetical protein B0J14DRAFT_609299 [Halenospora varia]
MEDSKKKSFRSRATGALRSLGMSPRETYEEQERKDDQAQSQAIGGARAAWDPSRRETTQQLERAHPEADSKPLPNPPIAIPPRKPVSRRESIRKARKHKKSESKRANEHEPEKGASWSAEYDPLTLPQVMHVAEPFSIPFQGAKPQAMENEEAAEEVRTEVRYSQDNKSRGESQELRESLGRMFKILRDGQRQSPSIQFEENIVDSCSLRNIEKALENLFRSYRDRYAELDATEGRNERLVEQCRSLQKVNDDMTRKNEDLTETVSRLEKELRDQATKGEVGNAKLGERLSMMEGLYKTQEEKHDARVVKLQADYQSEKAAYIVRTERLEAQISETRHRYEDEIRGLKDQHSRELASQESSARHLLEETRRTAGDELATTKRDHGNKLADLTRTFETQFFQDSLEKEQLLEETKRNGVEDLARTEREYDKKLAELRSSLSQAESLRREEIAALERKKQLELDDLIAKLGAKDKQIVELKKLYNEEMEQMVQDHRLAKEEYAKGFRHTVETLKEALVTRDNFSAMSDHELKERFKDISVELDEVARIEWDKGLERSWPFSIQYLKKGGNERRTKKTLIQNTLWVILYESIFYTPFRFLGREGKALEDKWRDKYGEARNHAGALAHCPRASKESEKWRYETMKSCVEATGRRLDEGDANYSIQQSYEQSLVDVRNDILQELGKVAQVSGGKRQSIEELVKKAAELWLDVGQQRYRMFLLMSDSGTEPARSKLDHTKPLTLVVVPELRRMGTALGEQLDKDELVLDCKGKFSVFSTT